MYKFDVEKYIYESDFPMKHFFLLLRVINQLNLDKISNVMKFLDWRYVGSDDSPDTTELFDTVTQLGINAIERCMESKETTRLSTGGFTVAVIPNNDSFYISISFEIESGDNCD